MFNKIFKSLYLIVICVGLICLSSCQNIFNNQNGTLGPETFDECTQNIFTTLIGGDDLTINYYFNDPESFGIFDKEVSLPTPHVTSGISLLATNVYFSQIKRYNYDLLNEDQKMTYNIICDLVNNLNEQTVEMSYLSNNYLGSYLGYQAQLPLLLVEYHFRNINDLNSYFKYLELIPETFKAYCDFEVKKSDLGYGMPDFVIDKVVNQCQNFIIGIDTSDTFMLNVIEDKIMECSFLSDEEKLTYVSKNVDYVNGYMREGYEYVKNFLPSLKGKALNNEGLANSFNAAGDSIGKRYYEIEFKSTVGYDISCDDAIVYLEDKLIDTLSKLRGKLIRMDKNESDTLDKILNGEIKLMANDPMSQLEYYKTLILSDFPRLSVDPVINLKYIDESMQNNFSPAAYMTSPLDSNGHESIYLNPLSIYEETPYGKELKYNYLYTTLAHEGIPGHLYQNVYTKSLDINNIRKVLRNTGNSEGWATYCEYYMYNYLRPTYGDNVVDCLHLYQRLEAAIYSRLDLGIHYNGWSLQESYDFMSKYLSLSNVESFRSAYEQLVEIPTNYQQYFFTYLKLCDMEERAKDALGDNYIPVLFHQTILDLGPCALKYVEQKLHEEYGI